MIDYEPDGRAAITAGENNPTENRGRRQHFAFACEGEKAVLATREDDLRGK